MTIQDTDKLDYVWKKVIYGTTKTANGLVKLGSNETITSPLQINPSQIWSDASEIPATPPANATAVVDVLFGSNRIRATSDPTSPPNQSWFATNSYNNVASIQNNWISPVFGAGYIVNVWVGDPNSGPAARIFQDTTGYEFVFDYSAGVLNFVSANGIPANIAATVGSGNVSVATNGIFIEGYVYTGNVGSGAGAGNYVPLAGGTMTGPLVFDYQPNDAKTVLTYANAVSNSYAGMGTLSNGVTRVFADSNSNLSFGHISQIDGETYIEAMSIQPDGTINVGATGNAYITTEIGNQIILGHQDVANNGTVVEDFVIAANGVAYSQGYPVLTTFDAPGVLTNTGVVPGTYYATNLVVDSYGLIVSASNGTSSNCGGVTSISLAVSSPAISINSPNTITTTGTFILDLSNTGVAAGTYTKVSVDVKGRVLSASALASSDVTTALGFVPLANNQTTTLSGDVTGSGTNAITTSLANVGTPGTYGQVVVDAKGRVISGTPTSGGGSYLTIANAQSTYLTIANAASEFLAAPLTFTGDVTGTGSNSIALTLASVATAGTYEKVVIDAKGRVLSGAALASSDISNALGFTPGVGTVTSVVVGSSSNITPSGTYNITTSGNFTLDLVNTPVTPGTYTFATIVVDSKGRIQAAQSGSAGSGTVQSVGLVANSAALTITGSPVTSNGTFRVDLSQTGVTAGTYTLATISVDAQGRILFANSGSFTGNSFVGPQGPQGNAGVGISNAEVVGGTFILTYTNNTVVNLGSIAGPQGATGATGAQGPQGNAGANGAGISAAYLSGGDLYVVYTGGGTGNLGYVMGNAGVGVANAYIANGYLNLQYTNNTTANVGYVVGPAGSGGSGSSSLEVLASNTVVNAAVTSLNFTGNGVSVTNNGSAITVNVPSNSEYVEIAYGTGANANPASVVANSAGVSAIINSATVTFTFTGYPFPPTSVSICGQSESTNVFTYTNPTTAYPAQIPGGGSVGSPTMFGNFTTMTLNMAPSQVGVTTGPLAAAKCYVFFRF